MDSVRSCFGSSILEVNALLNCVYCITSSSLDAKDTQATPVNPPVVLSKSKVSLADHLDLRNLPLSTTPGGYNFSLKALHPSEHTIKSARLPGGNVPSVALCCDVVVDIPVPNSNSRVQYYVCPNPLIPGSVSVEHESGGSWSTDALYDLINTAIATGNPLLINPDSSTLTNLGLNLTTNASYFRITSQSVTMELIAPALTDQGTITAWQNEMKHWDGAMAQPDSGGYEKFYHDWLILAQPAQVPGTLMGTAAYVAKAREGVYMPLKLTDMDWRSTADSVVIFEHPLLYPPPMVSMNPSTPLRFPYVCDRTGNASYTAMEYLPQFCGYNFGFIEFNGLSAGTTIRVRSRQVIEVNCMPGSVYAPMLEAPLPPDETAIKMYYEISGRMADAYPASYNDLGKLKDIISKIGKAILPYVDPALSMLSAMPGPIGGIATGVKMAAPAIQQVVKAVKSSKKKKSLPSAPATSGKQK